MERSLIRYEGLLDNKFLIQKFIDDCIHENDIWELLAILESEYNLYDNQYFNINKIDNNNSALVLEYLNQSKEPIDKKYLSFASKLSERGLFKKSIPKEGMEDYDSYLLSIGSISDFEKIAEITNGKNLGFEELTSLIKLPWEYYTWRALYKALNESQIEALPNSIKELVLISMKYPSRLKGNLSYKAYKNIACEFILFLIVDNHYKSLKQMLQIITLYWDAIRLY